MNRARWPATILALSVAFGATTAATVKADPPAASSTPDARPLLPGILGDDDRVILDSTRWPWLALGRVNRRDGGFCTGILIAPNAVLTAAHCLYDQRTGRRVHPAELHFLAGYRRGEYAAHGLVVDITTPWKDPRRAPASLDEARNDWAILRLSEHLTIRPIAVQPLPTDDSVTPAQPITGVLDAGYARNRPHLLSLHDGCTINGRDADRNIFFHTCDSTFGESGSPLLMRRENDFFVVALAVATTGVGSKARNVAVDANQFADTVRHMAVGEPKQAPLPQSNLPSDAEGKRDGAQ